MNKWQTESLRVTIFLRQPLPAESVNWWKDVAGADPEIVQAQPRNNFAQQAGPIFDGEYGLALRLRSDRVDWQFGPYTSADQTLVGIPGLGPLEVVTNTARRLLEPWFDKTALPLSRLAVGAVLLQPVSDHAAGYENAKSLLPLHKLNLAGAEDFLFQLNRPRLSKTLPDVRINRLTKLSVAQITGMQLSVGGPVGAPTVKPITRTAYAVRFEMDINTAADVADLPGRSWSIVEELFALAQETAERGDIP